MVNNACDFLGLDKALFQWKREWKRQQDPKSNDADWIYGSNVGYYIPAKETLLYRIFDVYVCVFNYYLLIYSQRERERERERERGERDFGDALFLNVLLIFLYA